MTVGLRACSPARPRHPASLPICVPSVERLPAALSRRLLAETTWRWLRLASLPPSGTFHPDRPDPCRAHERGCPHPQRPRTPPPVYEIPAVYLACETAAAEDSRAPARQIHLGNTPVPRPHHLLKEAKGRTGIRPLHNPRSKAGGHPQVSLARGPRRLSRRKRALSSDRMNSTPDGFIREDPWRIFRIMAEFVDSFETLSAAGPAVTIFGSARTPQSDRAVGHRRARGTARPGAAGRQPRPGP